MNTTDAKIYAINSASLMISMTEIEPVLKIVLLLVSIGYTVNKWLHLKANKDGKENSSLDS